MNLPLPPIRFLYRAMDLFSRKVGIVCGEKVFTYGQFGERVERLASGLRKLGVQPADRVAYLSFNTHQLLEGYYAAVMAGGIVMPINVRLSPEELASVLNHSGASILFFENDFASTVDALRAICPGIGHFLPLDAPLPFSPVTSEQLIASGDADRTDWLAIDELGVAELFYTSGSTGTPKGVALTHRTLYLHALSSVTVLREPHTIVDLHTIPLFHANGWGRPQSALFLGTKQVMVRRFEPAKVLQLIEEHGATDMCL